MAPMVLSTCLVEQGEENYLSIVMVACSLLMHVQHQLLATIDVRSWPDVDGRARALWSYSYDHKSNYIEHVHVRLIMGLCPSTSYIEETH